MSPGMSKKALIGSAVLAAFLPSLPAQAAPLPGFVLAGQTPRLTVYTRGGKVDAQQIDRTVARLEQTLGHKLNKPAEYYRYGSPQEVAAGTGHYAAGVTFAEAGQVHSVEANHEHELVHLVAGQMGDPGVFFQEGLAVALGNSGKWQGKDVDGIAKKQAGTVSAYVAAFERCDPAVAYSVAGSFVGWLIKTQSVEKVAEFFRSCPRAQDSGAAFARVFGKTVEQAEGEWRATL
jgi:hypothetical protein